MITDFFDTTVDILQKSEGSGWGDAGTWVIIDSVEMGHRYSTGSEIYRYDKLGLEVTDRFYSPVVVIDNANRLQYDDKVYDIKLVNKPTRANFLQIDALYLPDEEVVIET